MKKWLRIVLCVLGGILVLLLVYASYVFLSYHRTEDMFALPAEGVPSVDAVPVGEEQTILTFNIGFGAYEPDFGFFMDGGAESWAFSKERLNANLDAIAAFIEDRAPDLLCLQEVDENGTRTYHVNERAFFTERFPSRQTVWAQNWDCPFLFWPPQQPHGRNISGILTFSPYPVTSAVRRSLPVEDSVRKILDYDRCYSVSRIPTESGRELVLYNVHLSAYTSDGSVAVEQLRLLLADMQAEYEQGNYALCGGDFNKDLLGNSGEVFGVSGADYAWAQPFPIELLDGTGLGLCVPYDEADPIPSCRNADGPYHEGQFLVTLDGFLVSDNIKVSDCAVIDTGFVYSDHNPVTMTFMLKP